MKTMTKMTSTILLIALITFVGCKETKKEEKKSIEQETVVKPKNTINKELLAGSWLDQSEAALHFTLFEDGTARSDNMTTLLYEKWKLEGSKLTLTVKSVGNGSTSVDDETYEVATLTEDKMVLKNGDYLSEYLRKK